jgi:hypothetical protein
LNGTRLLYLCVQVLADLKLAPRVEREGLFVRWAGKKRDIVDEVLVRELQVS